MADEVITNSDQLRPLHADAVSWLAARGRGDLAVDLGRASLVRVVAAEIEGGPGDPFDTYTEPTYWLEARGEVRSALADESEWRPISPEEWDEGQQPGLVIQAFQAGNPWSPSAYPTVVLVASPAEVGRHQGDLYPGRGQFDYEGVRYRSRTETRVAAALDEANVLYLPLPTAVRHHQKVEPDFLVVHFGRIGVLEIDGPHHTPMTRAREDARAAWLLQSGVRLVHHVEVAAVDRDVDGVVRNFLALLRGPTL